MCIVYIYIYIYIFVFYRDFQTLKNNKSTRSLAECFLVFGNPGKTIALVLDILLPRLNSADILLVF